MTSSVLFTQSALLKTLMKKNEAKMLFLLCCFLVLVDAVYAQTTVLLSGVVTSQSGEPLDGVSIVVKGGTRVRLHNPEARPNIEPKHVLRSIPQSQVDAVTTGDPYDNSRFFPGWN